MLERIKPQRELATILTWEGIVIDPIGATLAVLVFGALMSGLRSGRFAHASVDFILTVGSGLLVGWILGRVFLACLVRFWIPDFLHIPATLTVLLGAFVTATALHDEAGYFAATFLGIVMANQRRADVAHLLDFSEVLRTLLIACLFIVLAARVPWDALRAPGLHRFAFNGALIFFVRPLAVWISCIGSPLTIKQKLFLAGVAPRGIVAAATASVFGIRLLEAGHPQAELILPLVFFVIVGTVLFYGIFSPMLARALGVATPARRGTLIVGASLVARTIAKALRDAGCQVVVITRSRRNLEDAVADGLPVEEHEVLSAEGRHAVAERRLRRVLSLTSDDAFNGVVMREFLGDFERSQLFRLPLHDKARGLRPLGRVLFGEDKTSAELERMIEAGATVRKVEITSADQKVPGTPLFVLHERLAKPVTIDPPFRPVVGTSVLTLDAGPPR